MATKAGCNRTRRRSDRDHFASIMLLSVEDNERRNTKLLLAHQLKARLCRLGVLNNHMIKRRAGSRDGDIVLCRNATKPAKSSNDAWD